MDETQELLRVILGRLEEMSADLKGLRVKVDGLELKVDGLQGEVKEFRTDTNERLEKIEERMDYLFAKWGEHDEEIHKIKRRQV